MSKPLYRENTHHNHLFRDHFIKGIGPSTCGMADLTVGPVINAYTGFQGQVYKNEELPKKEEKKEPQKYVIPVQ